ncbi:hypothetical protein [Streptomyces tanashiensis]|uniref:hypothetical protein n=1 Tax=Streptomyces tanashiensis TaxID=67367 RepID=UPI003F4D22F0
MSLRITALTDPAHGAHSRRLAWLAADADSNPVGLLADTADSNTHMRHISESLGYLPTHTTLQYQLDL